MPCDVVGDSDPFLVEANGTFGTELVLIDWILRRDDGKVDDKETIDERKGSRKPMDHLVFYSGRGNTTEYGTHGYGCSLEFIRDYQDNLLYTVNVDKLENIRILLAVNESVGKHKNPGYQVKNLDNHLLQIDVQPLQIDHVSNLKTKLQDVNEWIDFSCEINENICKTGTGMKKSKPVKSYSNFIGNHVVVSVFEFIDTKFLIRTCSKVCAEWFRMLFYNEQVMGHIFKNRILNHLGNTVEPGDLMRLNEYYHMNWMETYLMSGMFVIETFWDVIDQEFNRVHADIFHYMMLKLDPLQHLDIPIDHPLSLKLSKYEPKLILISFNVISSVSNRLCKKGLITHLLYSKEIPNLPSLLKPILFTKCITKPPNTNELSIDMKKGIPLYLEFLKSVSAQLTKNIMPKMDKIEQVEWLTKCLCEMQEKAQYFLREIMPHYHFTKFRVGDDLLIGLHLILLNNMYEHSQNLYNIAPINTLELLENRIHGIPGIQVGLDTMLVTELLPSHFQIDLLELLMNGPNPQYQFNYQYMDPLETIEYGLVFIKEHLIDLSKVTSLKKSKSEWIDKEIEEYSTFICAIDQGHPGIIIPKSTDLLFHFHMLHPNEFFQDCIRFRKSIKPHKLNFGFYEWSNMNNTTLNCPSCKLL